MTTLGCCWCGRTNTHRVPANPAVGDREECQDVNGCIDYIAAVKGLRRDRIAENRRRSQP